MTHGEEPTEIDGDEEACWCCGTEFPDHLLTHLGARPEAALCRSCAHHVHRRASRLPGNRSMAARVRRSTESVRERLVAQGLHEKGLLGRVLRWVDRFLP